MIDFHVHENLPLTYTEACAVAKAKGTIPCTDLAEPLKTSLKNTAEKVFSRVTLGKNAKMRLMGIFVYSAGQQKKEHARESLGMTIPFGKREDKAVIGLSAELLQTTRPIFWRYLLCHELAHCLTGHSGHDEEFTLWLNSVCFAYFGVKDFREDGADVHHKTDLTNWRY